MPSYTPYVAHTKRVTARLRARMHKQSFGNTVLASAQAERTDVSRVADARLRELMALRADHQRTFDPIFKQKALNLLQTLPLKAAAEDPHFSYTLGALRVCGYFSATQSPATFNLLNHATRHSFLLDAFNCYQLFLALKEMRHPQTAEILSLVLPRVVEVATDFTEGEARLVLDVYCKHNLLTMELSQRLAGVIIGSVNDLNGKDLTSAVSAVPNMGTENISRRFLEAATPRLCRALRETTEQIQLYKATYLQPAGRSATASDAAQPSLIGDTDGEKPPIPDKETPTERTLRRRKEEEWRRFLINQIYEGVSLHCALQQSIEWLCWAPRSLLNELVRFALLSSEPLLPNSAEQLSPVLTGKVAGGGASSGTLSADGKVLAAVVAEHENYVLDLPQVRRRSLCHCLKMLQFTSYRHLPALRLLSARIAAMKDATGSVSPLVLARELSQAVEAVAFFHATECAPAVTAIIDEILEHIEPVTGSPALLNDFHALSIEEVKLVEGVVLRVLLSCARLLSSHILERAERSELGTVPAQEAMHTILAQSTALATSPIAQSYVKFGLRLMHPSKMQQETDTIHARGFISTIHLLYATTVILTVSAQASAVPAAHDVLRTILRQLVPWAQRMATVQASEMPEEAAVWMAKALALLKKHPEIMDTPAGTTMQRESNE
ncbi:hypothetical protein, conserved [Leishmania tarentolae]|uniref:Mitochondrial RNA binding protein n=1 Tax=Leishmania tarentolae TaxID=5689 RepID=A0A640KQ89_LEITA|nr:hypothetical protein, conserved [Leishmania tarentolae]